VYAETAVLLSILWGRLWLLLLFWSGLLLLCWIWNDETKRRRIFDPKDEGAEIVGFDP
jgi:hypothetical protein